MTVQILYRDGNHYGLWTRVIAVLEGWFLNHGVLRDFTDRPRNIISTIGSMNTLAEGFLFLVPDAHLEQLRDIYKVLCTCTALLFNKSAGVRPVYSNEINSVG